MKPYGVERLQWYQKGPNRALTAVTTASMNVAIAAKPWTTGMRGTSSSRAAGPERVGEQAGDHLVRNL